MGWHATLDLAYTASAGRTVGHGRHQGPLRVLKSLYPEGPGCCHHVLVHPPAGLVGGDRLDIALSLAPDTHALLTTPGSTRWYRSQGEVAVQAVRATVAAGARLEWLPLDNVVYSGAQAHSQLTVTLAPGAGFLGAEVTALGLPAAQQPFVAGCWSQRTEIEGLWLDQARVAAQDTLLLDGALGLAGYRAMGSLWFAWGSEPQTAEVEAMLDLARAMVAQAEPAVLAGVSRVQPRLVVLRALAHRTEPLWQLLRAVRLGWRQQGWGLAPCEPRVWGT